eukprot:TRINITY_DN11340_c1_g1_i7.p1 TRINITY_DN11340_c1_g1~~TRINITY_DN11340_c1_g1_i7.p1  ORF type:complete len:1213 (+),score=151.87 TRINITY_DN11340_c1_g1_i7:176-3814(+)
MPFLDDKQALFDHLRSVKKTLDEARGIQPLHVALKAAEDARLPEHILSEARIRLSEREDAEATLQSAMESKMVAAVVSALQNAVGKDLPSERVAHDLLLRLQDAEAALKSALSSKLIDDLASALDKTAASQLCEKKLISEATDLLKTLREEQSSAAEQLRAAMGDGHPLRLQAALESAVKAQVPERECNEARDTLKETLTILEQIAASRNVEERTASLELGRQAGVPHDLLECSERQLTCLNDLLAALARGSFPALKRTLKMASVAGVTASELKEAESIFENWIKLMRDVEVAAGVQCAAMLDHAIGRAREAGINEDELEPAVLIHKGLLRRDEAVVSLHRAIAEKKCESLHAALHEACNSEDMDIANHRKAHGLLARLWALRSQLQSVIEKPTLRTLYTALIDVRVEPALPESELKSAGRLLEEERSHDQKLITGELVEASLQQDHHAMYHALGRARKAAESSAVFDETWLIREELKALDEEVNKLNELQADIRTRRFLTIDQVAKHHAPIWIDVEPIPIISYIGELSVPFKPAGDKLLVLPIEIVEGVLSIPMPDKDCIGGAAYDEKHIDVARMTCQRSWETLCATPEHGGLLQLGDSAVCGAESVVDDGIHMTFEVPFTFYLRHERSHGLNFIESLYDVNPASTAVPDDLEAGLSLSMGQNTTLAHKLSLGAEQRGAIRYLRNLRTRLLRRVRVTITWRQPKAISEVCDIVCLAFDSQRLIEIVDPRGSKGREEGYVSTESKNPLRDYGDGVSVIKFAGSAPGEASIDVRLDLLPDAIQDLLFSIHCSSSRDISKFCPMEAHVMDLDSGARLASYSASAHKPCEGLLMLNIFRLNDGMWYVNSFGRSCHGMVKDYSPLMQKLVGLGYPRQLSMRQLVTPLLEGMSKMLNLPRTPKATSISLDDVFNMRARFAIENFETDSSIEDIAERSQQSNFRSSMDECLRFKSERFVNTTVEISELKRQPLRRLRVVTKWDFPAVKDAKPNLIRYVDHLDVACLLFEGRALQEIVDYSGPHGVRIVHDGILDYSGMWVGRTGVGDATNGAVRYIKTEMDAISREGTATIDVDLEQLPSTTSDIYFVVSCPADHTMAEYCPLRVSLHDGEDASHSITCSNHNAQADAKAATAVVMCRVCRTRSGSSWRFEPTRSACSGDKHDYRAMIATLRAAQQRDRTTAVQWPHNEEGEKKQTVLTSRRNRAYGQAPADRADAEA